LAWPVESERGKDPKAPARNRATHLVYVQLPIGPTSEEMEGSSIMPDIESPCEVVAGGITPEPRDVVGAATEPPLREGKGVI
jgi:hypothetical protein